MDRNSNNWYNIRDKVLWVKASGIQAHYPPPYLLNYTIMTVDCAH
ncbi:MAG: hypothetical protein AB9903_16850 [Vulcanimicrobiota bacterium]